MRSNPLNQRHPRSINVTFSTDGLMCLTHPPPSTQASWSVDYFLRSDWYDIHLSSTNRHTD